MKAGLAEEALKGLQTVVKNLIEARDACRADPTLTEAAQVLAVDDLHTKLMPTATKRIDAAHSTIGKAIETLAAELRTGFTSTGPHAAEIRAHCKALSTSARMTLLNKAINTGDMTTLSAVLGAPSYLSGLDAEMAAALTERANVVRAPLTAKRLALLKGAQAKLEHAGAVAIGNYEALIGASDATIRRLRVQREKTRKVIGAIVPAA